MEFNKYAERGAYHWEEYKHQNEYGKHANLVKEWMKNETNILDIGAGDGLITHLIKAIEIDDNRIAVQLAKEKGVNVTLGSVYQIPYGHELFNAVYLGDVIEHLEHPDDAMREIYRVLKPGGRIYVVTPPALPSGKLQDKYHYLEYTPVQLTAYMESQGEIKIVKHRMYGRFIKV